MTRIGAGGYYGREMLLSVSEGAASMEEGHDRAAVRRMVPPLSPLLLLGLAVRPLPTALLQPLFDAALRLVRRRHPDILERMEPWAEAAVCIDPIDLPFVLRLEPHPERPRLAVCRRGPGAAGEVAATIRGPLAMLVALAEGRVDGDALFFTRDLVIEGDTEVVVALRNAVDGAGISLIDDIATLFGPFAGAFRRLAGAAARVDARIRDDIETLRGAVLAPLRKEADAQAARLGELEGEVRALRRAARRERTTT